MNNNRRDLYADLGVDAGADPEEIKKAYRARAKETHQDKGGDPDEFQKVHTAYLVLSDPRRRRKYDDGGTIDVDPADDAGRIMGLCSNVFVRVLAEKDPESDLIKECRQRLDNEIMQMQANRRQGESAIAKAEKAQKRLTRKKGPAFLEQILANSIRDMRAKLAQLDENVEMNKKAIELFDNYNYDAEEAPQFQSYLSSMGISYSW